MSGARAFRRSVYAAATVAALQLFAAGSSAKADVRVNDFEPPIGSGVQGWFGYNGNIAPVGTVTSPVGGASSGSWMYITLESGAWTTAGPTIQPWANSNFSDAAFQANNFLQFDVILPSMAGAAAVGYPSEGWVSGATGSLGFGVESAVTSGGTAVPDLGSVNIGSLDVVQHVVLNYSTLKSSNTAAGGTHFIDGWMNLLVDHPDETLWTNVGQSFIPQVYVDNIYLTMTSAIPLPLPAPADGTWDNTKSGDWVNAGNTNWVGGVAANGTLNSATFPQAAALRTVNSNVPGLALGTINLNSTSGYTITGSPLTLGGSTPTVNVTGGNNSIAGVTISSSATFSVADGASLAISDFTTGGYGSVYKTGPGAMSVNQINAVTLSAEGTFTITSAANDNWIFTLVENTATTYVDLGNNNWKNNQLFGGGTIKIGGRLSTALYGDSQFDGVITGGGSLVIGSTTEGQDHVLTLTGNNTFTGGVTVNRGTLIAANLRNGTVAINDPALTVDGLISMVQISAKSTANDPAGTSVLASLTIGGSGKLDLTNNSMIVKGAGATASAFRAELVAGSVLSSSADATHKLGYGDNAVLGEGSFGGQTVGGTDLLVKYTYGGDANLDGQVDVTDLGALATNWQTSAPWTGGDFNYDGFVDVTDLGMLATNWQAGVGSPLGRQSFQDALAAVGLGGTTVPEPATFGLSGLILARLASRRPRS